jgi:hypothetical protein
MEQNQNSSIASWPSLLRRVVKWLFLLFLAAFFLCVGLVVFIRLAMDGNLLARFMIPRLEIALHKKISLNSINVSWLSLGTAKISVRELEIRDHSGGLLLLRVPEAVCEIDALSALVGAPKINRIAISDPEALLPALPIFREDAEAPSIAGRRPWFVRPVVHKLALSGGRIYSSTADLDNPSQKPIISNIEMALSGASFYGLESFSVKGKAPGTDGSVQIDGQLTSMPFFGEEWRSRLRIRIERFPVAPFRLPASYLNFDFPFLGGLLNLDATIKGESNHFLARGNLAFSDIAIAPGDAFFRNARMDKGWIRFTADRQNENLRLDLLEVGLPGIKFGAEIKIRNFLSRDRQVEISLKNGDIDFKKFFPLLPLKLMKNEDRERLTEAGLNGHILITSASWMGKPFDVFHEKKGLGRLFVDAYLDKVSGFIPGAALPVKNATGRVRLSANEMIFKGISVTIGSSPIVINGWLSDLQTAPKADLFLSLNGHAQDFRPVFENRLVAGLVQSWVGSIADAQGGLSVTMDVKGLLKNPTMKGRVALEDFQCRFSRFPLAMRKINGALRFRGSAVTFNGLKGTLGDTSGEISGSLSAQHVDITGDFRVAPADLKKLNVLSPTINISGSAPVSLTLKGRHPTLNFSARVNLKNNGLRIGSVVKKNPGTPLELDVSGFSDSEATTVDQAYLILDGTRISAKGKIATDGKTVFYINLPPKGVSTNALVPLADPTLDLQPGGRIEGDAAIKIGADKSARLQLDSSLVINHVSLRLAGFHKRWDGVTGSIRIRGRSLKAVLDRAKIGGSEISGTIYVSDFDNPKVEIVLESPFLDTTDFTAPPGHVSKVTWGEWIRANPAIRFLARSRGGANVRIAKGKTAARSFSNFQAGFEGAQGLVKAPKWQVEFADGTLRGSALFDIRGNTRTPLSLEIQGDHLRMERMLTSDPDRVRIEGEVTTEGRMEWRTSSRREHHGIYKTGKIEVRVQDGILTQQFDIPSKISAALNFGSLVRGRLPDFFAQGLPFRRLTWTMEAFDNKWKIKALKLSSDSASIDGFGMYFDDQDRIDLKLDVSPLVGLDTIVSGILGNMFAKNGKTLTFPFRVRGLSNSLDVRLEPFEPITSAEH